MAFTKYKGYYLLDWFPLWSGDRGSLIVQPNYSFGTPYGYTYPEEYRTYPRNKRTLTYVCKNWSEIAQLDSLFDSLRGRYQNVWFPSWRSDIELTSDVGSADTTINITDIDYSTNYPATPGTGRHLLFHHRRNKWYARKVDSVTSDTQLVIESSLGVSFSSSNLVTFLFFGRLDVDEIEWEYITPTIAQATLTFIELPDEYPS